MKVLVRKKSRFGTEIARGSRDVKVVQKESCEKQHSEDVTVLRILELLCVAMLLYVFIVSLVIALLMAFDATLGTWEWTIAAIQGHPVLGAVGLVLGFLAFLISFASLIRRQLRRNRAVKEEG